MELPGRELQELIVPPLEHLMSCSDLSGHRSAIHEEREN